jgi:hypothetical protein
MLCGLPKQSVSTVMCDLCSTSDATVIPQQCARPLSSAASGAPGGGARAGVRGNERGQHARGALAQLPLRKVVLQHGRQRARAARQQQAAGRARRARDQRLQRLRHHRRRRRLRRQSLGRV